MLTIHDLKGHEAPLTGNSEVEYDRKLNAVDQITVTLYDWPENSISYPMITERALLELPQNGQLFRILTREEQSLGEVKSWTVTAFHVLHDLNDKLLHNKDKKNKPDQGDEDAEPQGVTLTLDQCMAYITTGTKFTYEIDGDFGTHTFADMPEGKALDIFLNTLVPTYLFEFTVDNYHIHIQRQIGRDNAFVFVDNGNVSAIQSQYDDTTLTTHILGECTPLVTEDDLTSAKSALDDANKDAASAATDLQKAQADLTDWQKNHTKDDDYKNTLKDKQQAVADAQKVHNDAVAKVAPAQQTYDHDQQVYTASGADGNVIYGEYTSPNAAVYGVIDADYFVDDEAHTKSALQQDLPQHLQDYPKMTLTLTYHEFEDNATIRSIDDVTVGNTGFIRDRYDIDISSRIVELKTYLDSPNGHEPEVTFGNVLGDFATTMAHLGNVANQLNNAGGAIPGVANNNQVVANFFGNATWTQKDVSGYLGRS